jgi:NAD-dependent histone deacetylase SIR2
MGTSLKVHGLKKLVKEFARTIHENAKTTTLTSKPKPKVIFVNKSTPGSEWADIIDYHVAGETDAWVAKVIEDWKQIKSADWETQQTLDGSSGIARPFKPLKLNAETTKTKKCALAILSIVFLT